MRSALSAHSDSANALYCFGLLNVAESFRVSGIDVETGKQFLGEHDSHRIPDLRQFERRPDSFLPLEQSL